MTPSPAPGQSVTMQLQTPQGPVLARTDEAAAPGAPAAVLLHALGTDMSIWNTLASQLKASRNVILLDAPGHGDGPAWPVGAVTLHNLAQSVASVLEQLSPTEPVDMVGTSMGAVIALQVAKLTPRRVRRLVLCGALLVRTSESATDMLRRAAEILRSGMGPLTERMLSRWFPLRPDGDDAESIAQLRALMLRTAPEAYAACSDALSAYDLTDALHTMQSNTLLIAGEQDNDIACQLAKLHRACPGSAYTKMAATGHFPHLQRPAEFARLVERFLAPEPTRT